jgi:hypothetical protein
MDSFHVRAEDTSSLSTSHIVQELQQESADMDEFPALIGSSQIGYFHDIDGGYSHGVSGSDSNSGYHVVNLIHRVQGHGSPPNKTYAKSVELHLDDWYYNLTVVDAHTMSEYPDDDFVLSLKVTDYMMGRQSFSEALSADIDRREQEFSPNGERK